MPRIYTCGRPNVRRQFDYNGSVQQGVEIDYPSGIVVVTSAFFHAILAHFNGQLVYGGFNHSKPTSGGLGEWIANNSQHLNSEPLTPRHGSHIAAILQHERYVTCGFVGNAVTIQF